MPGATNLFEPARPRRAIDEIISQVRLRIGSGDLQSGDRLPPERMLAEQFSVSRNTVREALRMLEKAGIVQHKRGATGGAFIADGDAGIVTASLEDAILLDRLGFSDVTEAASWIMGAVVPIACERMTDEDLADLDENLNLSRRLTEAGDWSGRVQVNLDFHRSLATATRNPVMVLVVEALLNVLRAAIVRAGPRGDLIIESRERLMTHLHARDAKAAVNELDRFFAEIQRLWVVGD